MAKIIKYRYLGNFHKISVILNLFWSEIFEILNISYFMVTLSQVHILSYHNRCRINGKRATNTDNLSFFFH